LQRGNSNQRLGYACPAGVVSRARSDIHLTVAGWPRCCGQLREQVQGANSGPAGNRRSCRIPLLDEVQAEFRGDSAKLEWVVSLDGKKAQSETYKILAILGKPKIEQK
jgi:hypothetical protein